MNLMRRALVLGLLLFAVPALAHRFVHPKSLRVGVRSDRVLLSITYDVSPGREARQTRAVFDRNSDGRLDEKEQRALLRYLEQLATRWLEVSVDGARQTLKRTSVQGHQLDLPADAHQTLGASMLLTAPLPRGSLKLRIKDRDKDKKSHVPTVVDLAPQWQVQMSSQGELHPKARRLRRIRLAPGRALVLHLQR